MKLFLFLIFLALTVHVNAGSNESSSTTYVRVLYSYETLFVVEVENEVIPNPAGCSSSQANKRIKMHRDSTTDHIYSTLLAAKLTGTPVSFGVSGSECYNWGGGTIPVMYRIDVK